jgi:hypothetical protein
MGHMDCPGAPKKDVAIMAGKIWSDFQNADEHSLFFHTNTWKVQRQYVIRWTNQIRSKASTATDDAQKAMLEDAL